MLAKSIIAGTVLSLMAGGVVYFGTDVDAATVKEKVAETTAEVKAEISDKVMAGGQDDHPHSDKEDAEVIETSVDMPSVKTASGETIDPKKPTLSPSTQDKEAPEKVAETSTPDKPQKKWLDQYLKTDKTEEQKAASEAENTEEKPGAAKDLMERLRLTKDKSSESDTASFVIEEEVEIARVEEAENIWVEEDVKGTDEKNTTRKMLHDLIKKDRAIFIGEDSDGEKKVEVKVIANEDGETTIETETIDMGDGKMMKIVKKTVTSEQHDDDGKKMRIKVMTDKDTIGTEDIKIMRMDGDVSIDDLIKRAKSKDISGTVDIVMEQAEKIELPELRDRAYLDLVSYGLAHENYEVASDALTKIEQVELRDTARNRIAVTYAKSGNAKNAFEILDDIEVKALKDVMRLQVIEAMIAPEALPEDMQ